MASVLQRARFSPGLPTSQIGHAMAISADVLCSGGVPSVIEPSQADAERRRRIIAIAEGMGDLVTGDDGFVVYWPSAGGAGAYSAWHLRVLADELDRRNATWAGQIEADLSKCDEPSSIEG